MMWLKCPGTLSLHLSQSARYPMLKLRFMPGCHVQVLTVCMFRWWPLRCGLGVSGSAPSSPRAARATSTSMTALGCSMACIDGPAPEGDACCMESPDSDIGEGSRRLFCSACQSLSDWAPPCSGQAPLPTTPLCWWPMLTMPFLPAAGVTPDQGWPRT